MCVCVRVFECYISLEMITLFESLAHKHKKNHSVLPESLKISTHVKYNLRVHYTFRGKSAKRKRFCMNLNLGWMKLFLMVVKVVSSRCTTIDMK